MSSLPVPRIPIPSQRCCVCWEDYIVNRQQNRVKVILPCGHHCCQTCLDNLYLNEVSPNRRNAFPCPMCRGQFNLNQFGNRIDNLCVCICLQHRNTTPTTACL